MSNHVNHCQITLRKEYEFRGIMPLFVILNVEFLINSIYNKFEFKHRNKFH
jgi:hypothetical protein